MTPMELFAAAMIALVATSVLTLLTADRRNVAGGINLAGTAVGSIAMIWLAAKALIEGPIEFGFGSLRILGLTAQLNFHIDGLSAVFVILISALVSGSALYSIGYLGHYRHESLRRYFFPFPFFTAGMLAVVTTSDWFWFLVFWEVMTLASYFLVIFESDNKDNLAAGFIYFFMTHLTSAGLMVAVMFLSHRTGSFAFSALPELLNSLAQTSPFGLHLLLLVFFIAFGTKAGMYPFGIWLPAAHPAAPASVSALLSGIMIKIGVYGLLRVFVWMLPVQSAATVWGVIIAAFGVLSMVVGTLRALGEHDCKRLLAQSSIGQMGYILLGLGLGLVFMPYNPIFGLIALVGCLYHIVNHACFKSLLFFNSGSLLFRAGTRNLDLMGGMVKLMPVTAGCAIVGALSISGIPPFNGFVSKWLLYQSAIFGKPASIYIVYAVIAIFMSTVTLAYFIKYLGSAYLGTLPERLSGSPEGSPKSMEIVQLLLAAACLLLGVFPAAMVSLFVGILHSASNTIAAHIPQDAMGSMPWMGFAVDVSNVRAAGLNPIVVLIAFFICSLIAYAIYRSVRVESRPAVIWNCGEVVPDDSVRYRASSFYKPFRNLISPVYRKFGLPRIPPPQPLVRGLDFDRWLYFPIGSAFVRIGRTFSRIHNGVPQFYLLWQVVGLVLSIMLVFWLM
ncbi:MAG: dehydrogenase (quinone) [Acidobacteria bacterium]|nr:dehydrogenase (quinone) [Acidobacteriota bacterium]